MNRLTHERMSGINTGYWSPNKKQELVNALAAYEDTGLYPMQIYSLAAKRILDTDKLRQELIKEALRLQGSWEKPQDIFYLLCAYGSGYMPELPSGEMYVIINGILERIKNGTLREIGIYQGIKSLEEGENAEMSAQGA